MNKFFSQLGQLLCAYSKRLMVVLFIFISICETRAGGDNSWSASVRGEAIVETGGGYVYVNTSTTKPETDQDWEDDSHITEWKILSNEETTCSFVWHAKAAQGYKFSGWYNIDGEIESNEEHYPKQLSASSEDKDQQLTTTLSAKFTDISTIVIEFSHPNNGSFTAKHRNGGVEKTYPVDEENVVLNNFQDATELDFAFKASPGEGYTFLRWKISNTETGITTYYYNRDCQHKFGSSSNVEVEFIPTGSATFILKGDISNVYIDLDEAIEAATRGNNKDIVVYTSGVLYTNSLTAVTYTIPKGITLLVPGDEQSTKRVGQIEKSDFQDGATHQLFRYLTIPENVTLSFNGNLCVYAKVQTGYSGYDCGQPHTYGQINMSDGACIILNNGAIANVYGYIASVSHTDGVPNSRVIAESGATVYEMLRVLDYRGGRGTNSIINEKGTRKVFPFNHYYAQNIETILELKSGSYEYVSSGFDLSSGFYFATAAFIVPKSADYGFLKMSDSSKVLKYLDRKRDRLVIELNSSKKDEISLLGNIYINLSSIKLNSSDYVFPINPNIDFIFTNSTFKVSHPIALLPGSSVTLDRNSKLIADGNIFVYDKDQYSVDWPGSNNVSQGTYGYFRTDPAAPEVFRLVKQSAPLEVVRELALLEDAVIDVNGYLEGKIYTTGKVIDGTYSGGANIISSLGSGIVSFSGLDSGQKTYQVLQHYSANKGVSFFEIPITSARLKNGDNTYTAGDNQNDIYKYYPNSTIGGGNPGRWLRDSDIPNGIESRESSNEIVVNLPENSIPHSVIVEATSSDVEIKSIRSITFSNQSLSSDASSATLSGGEWTIPITYKPTGNALEKTAYTMTITFSCVNNTTGEPQDVPSDVRVYVTENYKPEFTITGGTSNTDENIDKSLAADIQDTNEYIINVAAISGNIASSNLVSWNISELSAPFSSTGTCSEGIKVTYAPTAYQEGGHSAYMTISATYTQENGTPITTTKIIHLNGTPNRLNNNLAFVSSEKEIYLGDVVYPLLENYQVGGNISFLFDGKETSDIVEVNSHMGNYQLNVKDGVNILQSCTISVAVEQTAGSVYKPKIDQMTLIVKPLIQWNWTDLYFGEVYTDPIVLHTGETDYTLEYISGCDIISYDKDNKSVTVGEGEECTATFLFTKGGWTVELTSEVYANPRLLDMCLSGTKAERTFRGITISSSEDDNKQPLVTYENGVKFATSINSGAQWTIAIDEVPDKLEFESTALDRWSVYESATESFGSLASLIPSVNGSKFSYQLNANTKYIRIVCSQGTPAIINDLCVYELEGATSQTEIVYLPISKNSLGTLVQTKESIVLNYVSVDKPLYISVQKGNEVLNSIQLSSGGNPISQLTATDKDNLYKQMQIDITNISHTVEETVSLIVSDEDENVKFNLPIRLYHRPQLLPLRTAEWAGNDAEKFYFYMQKSLTQYVDYDIATQCVKFLPSGSNQRFITFEFKGGPSYLSIETDIETTIDNWTQYWRVQVFDGRDYIQIVSIPQIDIINNGESLRYKVRWNLPYSTKSLTLTNKYTVEEHTISNLIIDGDPDLDVQPGNHTIEHTAKYNFTTNDAQNVVVTAINLERVKVRSTNSNFIVKFGETTITSESTTLDVTSCPDALGSYEVGNITFNVEWAAQNAIDEGLLIFTDNSNKELASVRLLGTKSYITADNADDTNMFTGFASNITSHPFMTNFAENDNYKYNRREIDLSNTFASDGTALFDYLIVYGETSTTDNTDVVTAPTGANVVDGVATGTGSNAKTPYYIYRKVLNQTTGKYDKYQIVFDVENANVADKAALETAVDANGKLIPHAQDQSETKCIQLADGEQLRVYVTGFCPYATTGYKKEQEGVWLFRGKPTAKLDLYLEDCHIYSRNKTDIGCGAGKFDFDYIFQEDYARGSGGVFVFECNSEGEFVVPEDEAFEVTIHTLGKNVLKSNFGCFYQIWGMRAYQVSSPIQIRVSSKEHVNRSRTILTFDDKWPTGWETEIEGEETITKLVTKRTNGFLSLQKQSNNAPSIDLGNPLTVVHFRGGRVELQNAQNVSDKYKTTLAISYRSGIMAAGGVELQMAYGIGTDDATQGKVYFHDGTTTVIPMYVNLDERKYYLMDPQIDQNGDTIKDANGDPLDSDITSCLRCPEQTYVRGGSICMLRACMSPTSKGGAPTDGYERLGRFFYTSAHGYTYNTSNGVKPDETASAEQWLVKPTQFPGNSSVFDNLVGYYTSKDYSYGVESVTPDKNNKLTLWIPEGYGGSEAEYDQKLTAWKTCMTYVHATIAMGYAGEIGGNEVVESDEDVTNLLYCHLDDYTHHVISDHTGEGDNADYSYEAPVKIPDGFSMDGMEDIGGYLYLKPDNVGEATYEMLNENDYKITKKIYYITTALADTWMNFTAPFDVENIYVVETYNENKLQNYFETVTDIELPEGFEGGEKYIATRLFQAKHNADFASFFGMAMALGSEQTFEQIKDDYLEWAYLQDATEPANGGDYYQGTKENYNWRGIYPLTHYDGSNFMNSHFFLYQNTGEWIVDNSLNNFLTQWTLVPQKDGNVLLHQGETYSMLFPHSWGFDDKEEQGSTWDYWTGKYLIFESTSAPKNTPHIVAGRRTALETLMTTPDKGTALLSGNASFAKLKLDAENANVALYKAAYGGGSFEPYKKVNDELPIIYPATSYLHMNMGGNLIIQRILRTGEIIYDTTGNGTITGGNMPTVGGGNDMFITKTAGGINVAVAVPQQVRVISSTGAVLYSGMVQTSVDVAIPTTGVYVVTGENEAQKILY